MNNNMMRFVVLNNECPMQIVHRLDRNPDKYNPDYDPNNFATCK